MEKLCPHVVLGSRHCKCLLNTQFLCVSSIQLEDTDQLLSVSLDWFSLQPRTQLIHALPLPGRSGLYVIPSLQTSGPFFSSSAVVWRRETFHFPTDLDPGFPENKRWAFGWLDTWFLDDDAELLSQQTLNHTLHLDFLSHSTVDPLVITPVLVEFSVICREKNPSYILCALEIHRIGFQIISLNSCFSPSIYLNFS